MVPCADSTASTRLVWVLHRLFPSRRVVVAATAVEVVAGLLGVPLPVHVLVGLLTHLVLARAA
jgi:hypothetical protein